MEVSDKDIYSYIVNLADDRTVLKMLSVNKRVNDYTYFKKILEKRYPALLQLKEENETYKHLYLRMVKYLAKLWEEYEIPHISSKKFDPERLYEKLNDFKSQKIIYNPYTSLLIAAAEIGDFKLAQHLIDKGGKINVFTYENAGSLEMLKFLMSKSFTPYWLEVALDVAKQDNNQPIIDFLESQGVKYI